MKFIHIILAVSIVFLLVTSAVGETPSKDESVAAAAAAAMKIRELKSKNNLLKDTIERKNAEIAKLERKVKELENKVNKLSKLDKKQLFRLRSKRKKEVVSNNKITAPLNALPVDGNETPKPKKIIRRGKIVSLVKRFIEISKNITPGKKLFQKEKLLSQVIGHKIEIKGKIVSVSPVKDRYKVSMQYVHKHEIQISYQGHRMGMSGRLRGKKIESQVPIETINVNFIVDKKNIKSLQKSYITVTGVIEKFKYTKYIESSQYVTIYIDLKNVQIVK
jgi:hypothetical protein